MVGTFRSCCCGCNNGGGCERVPRSARVDFTGTWTKVGTGPASSFIPGSYILDPLPTADLEGGCCALYCELPTWPDLTTTFGVTYRPVLLATWVVSAGEVKLSVFTAPDDGVTSIPNCFFDPGAGTSPIGDDFSSARLRDVRTETYVYGDPCWNWASLPVVSHSIYDLVFDYPGLALKYTADVGADITLTVLP